MLNPIPSDLHQRPLDIFELRKKRFGSPSISAFEEASANKTQRLSLYPYLMWPR
jgi:hypothetical protein